MNRSYKRWVSPALRELYRRKKQLGPEAPIKRSSFIEWNFDAECYAFGKRLHENFNESLLKTAFTHRSYILQEEVNQRESGIENPEIKITDNRDLAKTGETFLSKTVQSYLKSNLLNFPEPGQQAVHDYLTSTATLANISLNLGTKHIILSSEFPPEESTLASTFKAIIGALIQSSGEERATEFVKDFVITHLNGIDVNELWQIENPMELLKEKLQELGQGEPEPRLINEAGRNTILSVYQVGIYSDKKLIAVGSGESLAIAVEVAARESLKALYKTPDNLAPFKFNTPQAKYENRLQ